MWENPYLELLKGEAAALTDAAVVLDGRASHDGAELVDGAGGDGGGLGPAVFPAPGLRTGLHTIVSHKNTSQIPPSLSSLVGEKNSGFESLSYLVEVGADPTLPVLSEIYPRASVHASPKTSKPNGGGKDSRLLMSFWLYLIVCRRNQWSVLVVQIAFERDAVVFSYHFGGSRSNTGKGAVVMIPGRSQEIRGR